jgi:hypothetical protein
MNLSKKQIQQQNWNLKFRYNITLEEKNKRIINQSCACAICRSTFKNIRTAHVDHCHETDQLRGILCNNCNTGLGKFKDSIYLLEKAINYLKYYAQKNSITPVPVRNVDTGENYSPFGSIHGTRTRKNRNRTHDYSGQSQGELFDSSPEESSGVGVGPGVPEMGASEAPQSGNRTWYTKGENSFLEQFVEHICSESRELGMVIRTEQEVRLPNHRRIKSFQRFKHKKVQSIKETPKTLQETLDFNWDAVSSRLTRSLEPSGHIGLGSEVGDEPNKV